LHQRKIVAELERRGGGNSQTTQIARELLYSLERAQPAQAALCDQLREMAASGVAHTVGAPDRRGRAPFADVTSPKPRAPPHADVGAPLLWRRRQKQKQNGSRKLTMPLGIDHERLSFKRRFLRVGAGATVVFGLAVWRTYGASNPASRKYSVVLRR
jgi:hypothetical protein